MISVNTNDVQQSEITFDHRCVASRIMAKVLLMAGGCTSYQQENYSYMKPAFQFGKNIIIIT